MSTYDGLTALQWRKRINEYNPGMYSNDYLKTKTAKELCEIQNGKCTTTKGTKGITKDTQGKTDLNHHISVLIAKNMAAKSKAIPTSKANRKAKPKSKSQSKSKSKPNPDFDGKMVEAIVKAVLQATRQPQHSDSDSDSEDSETEE